MDHTCARCNGEGYETYDEDDRRVRDACYHCATTGKVDEETHFHDQLKSVADTLAYWHERDYRQACNEDPDGDGYDLYAAENGLSASDYFRCRVWERAAQFSDQLSKMDRGSQELLIAWNAS